MKFRDSIALFVIACGLMVATPRTQARIQLAMLSAMGRDLPDELVAAAQWRP